MQELITTDTIHTIIKQIVKEQTTLKYPILEMINILEIQKVLHLLLNGIMKQ